MAIRSKRLSQWVTTSPILLFVLLLVIAVVIGLTAVVFIMRSGSDWSQRAAMGEMLAGVGAVLSVLSFGALLFTVLLQHRQYELQRQDLNIAREMQEKSAQVLSKQIKMLRQSAECQALNTLVMQAEETITRFNDANSKRNVYLVQQMQPDMENVTERRLLYVERLRMIVGELAAEDNVLPSPPRPHEGRDPTIGPFRSADIP
jgi:uncharacterized membrane protein